MSEKKVKATTRVTITVEIDTGGSWGAGCTIEQVQKQAAQDAKTALMRGLVLDGLSVGEASKVPARIVGEPNVRAILVEDAL